MPRTIRDPRIQRFVLLGHPMSGTTGMISQIGREEKRQPTVAPLDSRCPKEPWCWRVLLLRLAIAQHRRTAVPVEKRCRKLPTRRNVAPMSDSLQIIRSREIAWASRLPGLWILGASGLAGFWNPMRQPCLFWLLGYEFNSHQPHARASRACDLKRDLPFLCLLPGVPLPPLSSESFGVARSLLLLGKAERAVETVQGRVPFAFAK